MSTTPSKASATEPTGPVHHVSHRLIVHHINRKRDEPDYRVFPKAALVWLPDREQGYILAKVLKSFERGRHGQLLVMDKKHGANVVQVSGKKSLKLIPADYSGGGLESQAVGGQGGARNSKRFDFDDIPELSEPGMLHHLRARFNHGKRVNRVGPVVILLNTFQHESSDAALTDTINQLARTTIHQLATTGQPQTCVFGGETCSGKSTFSRLLVNALLDQGYDYRTNGHSPRPANATRARLASRKLSSSSRALSNTPEECLQGVLESLDHVLRVFTSARTGQCSDSTRCSTLKELVYKGNSIAGIRTSIHLFEKSRVVNQRQGQNNYHVLYQLWAHANRDVDVANKLHLEEHASAYEYLSQGNTPTTSVPQRRPSVKQATCVMPGCDLKPADNSRQCMVHHAVYGSVGQGLGLDENHSDDDDEVDDDPTLASCALDDDGSLTSAASWGKLVESLSNIGFTESQIDQLMRILASVVNLGNIRIAVQEPNEENSRFTKRELYVDPTSKSYLLSAAELLGLDASLLERTLLYKDVNAGSETLRMPLTLTQAYDVRNTFAKGIYDQTLQWVVSVINDNLAPPRTYSRWQMQHGNKASNKSKLQWEQFWSDANAIAVFSNCGFEAFEKDNSLEQLWVNFANEALERMFRNHAVNIEHQRLVTHGVHGIAAPSPRDLGFPFPASIKSKLVWGNGCFSLLGEGMSMGLLEIIDEETKTVNGTAERFLRKTLNYFGQRKDQALLLRRPMASKRHSVRFRGEDLAASRACFTVVHYPGTVNYHVAQFMEKNKTGIHFMLNSALRESSMEVVRDVFTPPAEDDNANPQGVSKEPPVNDKVTAAAIYRGRALSASQKVAKTITGKKTSPTKKAKKKKKAAKKASTTTDDDPSSTVPAEQAPTTTTKKKKKKKKSKLLKISTTTKKQTTTGNQAKSKKTKKAGTAKAKKPSAKVTKAKTGGSGKLSLKKSPNTTNKRKQKSAKSPQPVVGHPKYSFEEDDDDKDFTQTEATTQRRPTLAKLNTLPTWKQLDRLNKREETMTQKTSRRLSLLMAQTLNIRAWRSTSQDHTDAQPATQPDAEPAPHAVKEEDLNKTEEELRRERFIAKRKSLERMNSSGNSFVLPFASQGNKGLKRTDSWRGSMTAGAGGKFKKELRLLVEQLNRSALTFVRCIKINNAGVPHVFDKFSVQTQIRSSGLTELCTVRQHGYTVVMRNQEFIHRYASVVPSAKSVAGMVEALGSLRLNESKWDMDATAAALAEYKTMTAAQSSVKRRATFHRPTVQMPGVVQGKDDVLIQVEAHRELEIARSIAIIDVCVYVQKHIRQFVCRHRVKKVLHKKITMMLEMAIIDCHLERLIEGLAMATRWGLQTKVSDEAQAHLNRMLEEKRVKEWLVDASKAKDRQGLYDALSRAHEIGLERDMRIPEVDLAYKVSDELYKERQFEIEVLLEEYQRDYSRVLTELDETLSVMRTLNLAGDEGNQYLPWKETGGDIPDLEMVSTFKKKAEGRKPEPMAKDVAKEFLRGFYQVVGATDKLKEEELDKVVDHFRDRPDDLIKVLETKYHVKFQKDGTIMKRDVMGEMMYIDPDQFFPQEEKESEEELAERKRLEKSQFAEDLALANDMTNLSPGALSYDSDLESIASEDDEDDEDDDDSSEGFLVTSG